MFLLPLHPPNPGETPLEIAGTRGVGRSLAQATELGPGRHAILGGETQGLPPVDRHESDRIVDRRAPGGILDDPDAGGDAGLGQFEALPFGRLAWGRETPIRGERAFTLVQKRIVDGDPPEALRPTVA